MTEKVVKEESFWPETKTKSEEKNTKDINNINFTDIVNSSIDTKNRLIKSFWSFLPTGGFFQRDPNGKVIGTIGYPTYPGWMPVLEKVTYVSAADPYFTLNFAGDVTTKYSVGMKFRGVCNGSTFFGFITTVGSYSNGQTSIIVYGGSDYDLSNNTITQTYFSCEKAPLGFILNPAKWPAVISATLDYL